MRYVTGIDENGDTIDVRDPLAMRMMAIAAGAGDDPEALFDGLVALTEVFRDGSAGERRCSARRWWSTWRACSRWGPPRRWQSWWGRLP